MLNIIRKLKNNFLKDKDIEYFFSLKYKKRVDIIKDIYSHKNNFIRMKDYFLEGFNVKNNTQFYFDVLLGYTKKMQPKTVHQLGCFSCEESRFLILNNFKRKIIASDYDFERLSFLKSTFKNTKFRYISFKKVDLEALTKNSFSQEELFFCNAVLSNIQPENIKNIFTNIFQSKESKKIFVVGDIYCKESLSLSEYAQSIRLQNERNWFHPYLSLAKKLELKIIFVPDFMFTSYKVARGIFIIYKNINKSLHFESMKFAYESYFNRQNNIWNDYNEVNINKHWVKNKKWD
tara:strand:- start:205 stop:1074 length:870 start_codon:yes stop_codon:yes gene_type:complete